MRPARWPPHVATFPAPAKLNLDLRITGRRSDGYHNLETVFCLIDLYDTVGLAVRRDGQIRLHTPTQGVPPEQDLVCRAAAALKQATGVTVGVDIWLHKNIPMGGGLGGGSSDAATVLMALNRLWGCHFSREQLMEVGLKLGADVPFFLHGFVNLIGEVISMGAWLSREFKNTDVIEGILFQKLAKLLKLFFGFSWHHHKFKATYRMR